MKTTRLLQGLITLVTLVVVQPLYAQDVSINMTPMIPSVLPYHTIGYVELVICNEDPSPITAPANRLNPLISFPDNLSIVDVVNPDGTPVTGFTVEVLQNDPGDHNVRVLYTLPLPNAECATFRIRVKGEEIGTGVITATLAFNGPQTPGNLTGNDNSTATLPVEVNLPVKLQSFNVSKEGNSATLSWVTTEEVNSERFDVERSGNGKEWSIIETVKALGDSKIDHTYTATDVSPLGGQNLYRLHMIDKDGSSAYSVIRNLEFEDVSQFVYPNPVSEKLMLDKGGYANIASVQIFDVNGKEIYKINSNLKEIDVSGFKAGMYLVRIKSKDGKETSSKILVVK